MVLTFIAIVLGSHILQQQLVDASFGPVFGHVGHPMKPHFIGPPMKPHFIGPPMKPHFMAPRHNYPLHGPPLMHGPHMHGPPLLPHQGMMHGPPMAPMVPPPFIKHKRFPPKLPPRVNRFRPLSKYARPMSKKYIRPRPKKMIRPIRRKLIRPMPKRIFRKMPNKYVRPMPPKYARRPISHRRLKRVLIIRRMPYFRKGRYSYGYGRQIQPRHVPYYGGFADRRMSFRRGPVYEHDNMYAGYNNDRERYRYGYNRNNNNRRARTRRPFDEITILDRRMREKRRRYPSLPIFNEGTWNYIDNGIGSRRRGIGRMGTAASFGRGRFTGGSSIRAGFLGNLGKPRLREVVDPGNRVEVRRNSLRARNTGGGRRRLSGNTLDFSGSTKISPIKSFGRDALAANALDRNNVDIQNERISHRNNRISINNERMDLSNIRAPSGLRKASRSMSGLGGSFIDLTNVNNEEVDQVSVSLASSSSTKKTEMSSSKSTATTAQLNGNVIQSAADIVGSGDVVIIDSAGQTATSAGSTTSVSDVLSSVVDLTSTTGALSGANIGNFGAVDILTLDNSAFAQLEQALQSGQTVNAQLLDSIIGSGAGVVSAGGPVGGIADVGMMDTAATPQIYILDGAQAQQITDSASFAGTGGDTHIIDSLTSSSSKTSKSSSSSSSSHSIVDIPHAGNVLAGGQRIPHGHGPVLHGGHGGHGMPTGHSMPGGPRIPRGHGPILPGGHGPIIPGGPGGHDIVGVVGEPVGSITVGSNTDILGLFSMPAGHVVPNVPASVSSIPQSIGSRMAVQPGGHRGHAAHMAHK